MPDSSQQQNNNIQDTELFDIDRFIEGIQEYFENTVINETLEEARAALIRSGVMDEEGNMIRLHEGSWA